MKIWDTFLFYNELDMLECRLTELEDTPIYKHLLVETNLTFQGDPKPMYYLENKERFAKWEDRILRVSADNLSGKDPWEREIISREVIGIGLQQAGVEPDDIIMLSDVDEIPRPEHVNEHMYNGVAYEMRQHMFSANWLHPEPWYGTVVQRYEQIDGFQNLHNMRGSWWPKVRDGGWHLTYLGGPDAVRSKVAAYSHAEDLAAPMEKWLEGGHIDAGLALPVDSNGMVLPKDDATGKHDPEYLLCRQQTYMPIDDSYPKWIREGKCPESWLREEDG